MICWAQVSGAKTPFLLFPFIFTSPIHSSLLSNSFLPYPPFVSILTRIFSHLLFTFSPSSLLPSSRLTATAISVYRSEIVTNLFTLKSDVKANKPMDVFSKWQKKGSESFETSFIPAYIFSYSVHRNNNNEQTSISTSATQVMVRFLPMLNTTVY